MPSPSLPPVGSSSRSTAATGSASASKADQPAEQRTEVPTPASHEASAALALLGRAPPKAAGKPMRRSASPKLVLEHAYGTFARPESSVRSSLAPDAQETRSGVDAASQPQSSDPAPARSDAEPHPITAAGGASAVPGQPAIACEPARDAAQALPEASRKTQAASHPAAPPSTISGDTAFVKSMPQPIDDALPGLGQLRGKAPMKEPGLVAASNTETVAGSSKAVPVTRTRAASFELSMVLFEKLLEIEDRTGVNVVGSICDEAKTQGFAHAVAGTVKPFYALESGAEEGLWPHMKELADTWGLKPGWHLYPDPENDEESEDFHKGKLVHEDDLLSHAEENMQRYKSQFGIRKEVTAKELVDEHIVPFWQSINYSQFDQAATVNLVSMGLGFGYTGDYYRAGLEAKLAGDEAKAKELKDEGNRVKEYVDSRMSVLKEKCVKPEYIMEPPGFGTPDRPDVRELMDRYLGETAEMYEKFSSLETQPIARQMGEDGVVACALLGLVFKVPKAKAV